MTKIDRIGFVNDLASAINRHCRENESNTPDFIIRELCHALWQVLSHGIVHRTHDDQEAERVVSAIHKVLANAEMPYPGAENIPITKKELDAAAENAKLRGIIGEMLPWAEKRLKKIGRQIHCLPEESKRRTYLQLKGVKLRDLINRVNAELGEKGIGR